MSGILSGGPTSCANCVQTDCSHSTDLPDIALICDLFLNSTFPPDVQQAIRDGDRCHICGAPAILGGGGRVTCGTCLLAQGAAKKRLGDKVVKAWRGSFASPTPAAPVPVEGGLDPDEIEEEDR
jgi:hypothetical protein